MKTTTYNKNVTRITIKNSGYLDFILSPSNCKLAYVDYASTLGYLTIDEVKELFKKINTPVIYITLTDSRAYKFIKDNFEVYFDELVPIGYSNSTNGGFQYHLLIKNNEINSQYTRPVIKKQKFSLEGVRDAILKVQKKYRRKTDLLDEMLNEITPLTTM